MSDDRPGTAQDDGFTLIEVMITLAIFTVALGLVFAFLTTAQRIFGTQQERSNANSQARLALEQMDREVRSGSVVRNPADEVPANYVLRILTQANNNNRCVQWRLQNRRLERRNWDPSYGVAPNPSSVSGWRVIAEHLTNAEAGVPPFTAGLVTTGTVRSVRIVLVVDENPSDTDSLPVRVEQSLSARNTSFNFPQPSPGPYVGGATTEPCQPEP